MTNRILRVEIRDHSLVPASAELRLTVAAQRHDAGTEVRGRLMGPRCLFASTVEVAYPLRPLAGLTARVLLPEASLWEPETPHLYVGPVELWQDGARADAVEVRHGLRHLAIGPQGLRLNGKPLALRGRRVESLTDAEALDLRRAGVNLLVAPISDVSRHVWEVADRVGFLVVGRYQTDVTEALLDDLAGHASALGWLRPGGEFFLEGGELRAGEAVLGVVEW